MSPDRAVSYRPTQGVEKKIEAMHFRILIDSIVLSPSINCPNYLHYRVLSVGIIKQNSPNMDPRQTQPKALEEDMECRLTDKTRYMHVHVHCTCSLYLPSVLVMITG